MSGNSNAFPLLPKPLKDTDRLEFGPSMNLNHLRSGGFKRGELWTLGAFNRNLTFSKGLQDLFAGKEDVVLGPEDHHQLFSGKSLITWHLIMQDKVLREQYFKATHFVYDFEAPAFDFNYDKNKQAFDEGNYIEIDSCSQFSSDPAKLPVVTKLPKKTKMNNVLSSIYPEPKEDV